MKKLVFTVTVTFLPILLDIVVHRYLSRRLATSKKIIFIKALPIKTERHIALDVDVLNLAVKN